MSGVRGALARFSWLCHHSRMFLLPGKHVEVIYTPDNYYEALKHGVQKAKKRVILSSLYLGTGSREAELVDALKNTLSDSTRPAVKCTMLLDHLRGSRGYPNSRSMVQELVHSYGEDFKLHLYHIPNLRGLLRRIGPERFNEVMGLQHMKIYIFDDDFILSGANLSRDYFVNRQDRYLKFKSCPQLADYFADLVETVASHSFTLKADGSTDPPSAVPVDPLSSGRAARTFRESLGGKVRDLSRPEPVLDTEWYKVLGDMDSNAEELDTAVFPLVQMGYYGITQDEVVTQKLLAEVRLKEQLYLASGYFNLPPQYIQAILQGQGEYKVLAASPEANGFYGAKGVAGHVPCMYIHFAKKFLEAVSFHGYEDRVQYLEFLREGWTFHGKGLWYYLPGEQLPSLTLVGSSNYGHRSLSRDLEAQVALVTGNKELREALHEEQKRMFVYSHILTLAEAETAPERKLNFLQWLATQMLKPHV